MNGKRKLLATIVFELSRSLDGAQHGEAEQQKTDKYRHYQNSGGNGCRHEAHAIVGIAEFTLLIGEQWLDLCVGSKYIYISVINNFSVKIKSSRLMKYDQF